MKKIFLGLLALSAVSFAANPGTTSAADITINAQLEVLPSSTNLVIEQLLPNGNWQPVTSPALFDHGKVTCSTTNTVAVPQSNVVKNLRVRRSDNSILLAGTPLPTKATIAFASSTTAVSSGNLVSGTVTGTPAAPATIPHTFTLSTTSVTPTATQTSIPFDITSNVPTIAANQLAGVYNRSEGVTVTLQ